MSIRVLIVDDSPFLRHIIRLMLESDDRLTVVGEALNGAEAVAMTVELLPDVITMDIEMPVMDGITATRRIMQHSPRPIMMFSSLTEEGAEATLAALEAGAVDFMPKRFEAISWRRGEVAQVLCDRLYAIAHQDALHRSHTATRHTTAIPRVPPLARVSAHGAITLVAVGTSTGGPSALQEVLSRLPADFPHPILLVQHMPGNFTPAFARRMDQLCAITVKQAEDGDELLPATALLAPGGKQMLLERRAERCIVRIRDTEPGEVYSPSVDLTLGSVAEVLPGQCLALILTGMGKDGLEGCRRLKSGGAIVWTQDEASCVVYGMPAAVVEAGLSDNVLSLQELGETLARL